MGSPEIIPQIPEIFHVFFHEFHMFFFSETVFFPETGPLERAESPDVS